MSALCQHHSLYSFVTVSLRLCNISWDLQSPIVFVFFAQGSFGYLELFLVPYEFKIFFLFLWRMLWKFWFGLYWIYKLILVAWSFSQYLILLIYEQYIFLNLFFRDFHCRGLFPPWLGLFQDILLCLMLLIRNVLMISLLVCAVGLWKNYWLFNVPLFWNCLLFLDIFWWYYWDLLCIILWHLQLRQFDSFSY